MKKLLSILLIGCLTLLTACTEETSYGKCIGAFDDRDPKLQYHVEGWNLAMGIIFFETVVVPVVVVADDIQCPVGPSFTQPK